MSAEGYSNLIGNRLFFFFFFFRITSKYIFLDLRRISCKTSEGTVSFKNHISRGRSLHERSRPPPAPTAQSHPAPPGERHRRSAALCGRRGRGAGGRGRARPAAAGPGGKAAPFAGRARAFEGRVAKERSSERRRPVVTASPAPPEIKRQKADPEASPKTDRHTQTDWRTDRANRELPARRGGRGEKDVRGRRRRARPGRASRGGGGDPLPRCQCGSAGRRVCCRAPSRNSA